MLKKLFALLLVLSLLSALAVPALGDGAGMSNFTRSKSYTGQYSDVDPSGWAYGAIKTCFETELMQGSGGKFNPSSNLTVAEALVMADRVHQIYHTGANTLTNGNPWYQTYVDYAVDNGIIRAGDFSAYNVPISRADMAFVFVNALPGKELSQINEFWEIPDLGDAPSRDRTAIETLYHAGVLTGSDRFGTFKPNANITRAEAAAIISRVAIPAERKQVTLQYLRNFDGLTFELPQIALLNYDTDEDGFTTYSLSGKGVAVTILKSTDAGLQDKQLTDLFTASELKESLSWMEEISIQSVSFGDVKGYRVIGGYTRNGNWINCVEYDYIIRSSIYRAAVLWGDNADASLAQQIVSSMQLNGKTPSPAYNP